MRVAYLLESTEPSGGVQVVLRQAEALARRGHRVAVVSPGAPPDWFSLTRTRFERSSFRESRELTEAQVRVATFWTTVAPALEGSSGPVFHLCQGYEGSFSFYADRRSEIEAAYRAPTRKLAISKTLVDVLKSRGFGPVENVGQAFDPRGFSPREGPANRDHPLRVLLVGPYEADVKGIRVGLEGLAFWRRRGAAFRLLRVSSEPAGEDEKATGLVDEYHHRLPPGRMPFAYRACHLFLGPARAEEGFGLPVVEALASGLPCLLSDTPGHREIAGEAAWYFRDGDPNALAERIPRAATPEALERARVEGPRRAARFDPDAVAEKLELALRVALADDGGPVA
jgi:glycosyltransferase involved in cell wall biosynthesis